MAGDADARVDAAGAAAAPAPVSVSAARFASARQLRLRTPAQAAAGDLLVAVLTVRAPGTARIWRAPGWTPVRRDSCTGPRGVTLTQALYVRVAAPGQAALSAWGLLRATSAVGGIVAYRGVDPRRPVADSSGLGRVGTARILAPSVAASGGQSRLVGFFAHSGKQPKTVPAGWSKRLEIATGRTPLAASVLVADVAPARAGESGRRVAGIPRPAGCSIGQLLSLRSPGVNVFPGVPVSTSPPTIGGVAAVGQQLTASPGGWAPAPASVAYRWRRCNAAGDACTDIPNASGASYTLASADLGRRLRVVVTATNAAGSTTTVSGATDRVAAAAPAPSPPAPPPTPAPSPLPPPAGSVVLTDRTWICRGPVNIPLVRVTMRVQGDAIHLREDCSGRIGRIEVDTWTNDGMKVNAPAPAAHDLVIEGGYIRCHASIPDAHQDGIQAMGGSRIRLVGLEINCNSNPNGQLFIAAANGGRPTDIVCEGCFLGSGAGSSLFVATSTRSGARDTLICPGRFSPIRIQGATEPVNVGNTVLPASDPRC